MSHQIEGSGKGKEVIRNGSGGEGGDDGCSPGGHGKRSTKPPAGLVCPRCQSRNSKFCYYNNGSIYQPRYYCSDCRRYWTEGGIQRNIPIGGPNRRQRRSASDSSPVSVIVLALPPLTQRLAAVSATATGAYSSVTAMQYQRLVNHPTLNALPRAGSGTNLGLVMSNSSNLPALQTTQRPQLNPYPYPYPHPHPGVQQQNPDSALLLQQPINWALHHQDQQQQQEPQEDEQGDMSNNNPIGDGSASSYAFVDDWLDISALMSIDNTTNDNNSEQPNNDLAGKEASS